MRLSAITVLLSVTLVALPSCERVKKAQERREAIKELENTKQSIVDNYQMTENGIEVDHEGVEKNLNTVNRAADKIGGKLGQAMKVATELGKEDAETEKELNAWGTRFAQLLDFQTLSKSRDYDARISDLNEFTRFAEEIKKSQTESVSKFSQRLDAIGFTGKEREAFEVPAMEKRKKMTPLVIDVRNTDIEIAAISIRAIELLKKADASWSWDTESQMVLIKNEKALESFNKEMTDLSKVAAEQQAIQQKIMMLIRQ